MKELELLLENLWIVKDEDKELYYRIKDSLPAFKAFVNEKLGFHVIINPYIVKLEKLPGKAEEWMGIQEFESPMEYAFLCILLMFLEDKGREEQFVLSQITEYIEGNYEGDEKVDWTLFRHRRCLIKVLRFASDAGIIKLDDGDETGFANDASSEVLYESTGLSRYFVRNFQSNILNYTSYRDIENEGNMDMDRDRGFLRRQRVYRRLIMSPVVYNEGSDDADYLYIKNFRGMLENDIEKYLDAELHVHRNGALLAFAENRSLKDCFPENKSISDIILLMNKRIREMIDENILTLEKDDTVTVSMMQFESIAADIKNNYSSGWSKEYREMDKVELVKSIVSYMKGFDMIESADNGRGIRIMPLSGKVIGEYPGDFHNDDVVKEVAVDGQ